MNLHDHMDRATETVTTDLDRLSRAAQNDGTRIRRRRHGLMAAGTAAAVATVAATSFAITAIGSDDATQRADDLQTTPSQAAPAGKATTVPLTGRSTVAALESAIKLVADGSFDRYAGQGDATSPGDLGTYGEVRFTPSDGSGFGMVGINVQDGQMIEDLGKFGCNDQFMLDCASRTLTNGDRLRTYREQPDGVGDVRQVAEIWTAGDELRIVASANNGTDLGSNQWDIERPDAVLTPKQLVQIVSQGYWGFEIPERFDAAGQQLSPYNNLDAEDDTSQPPGGQPLRPSADLEN